MALALAGIGGVAVMQQPASAEVHYIKDRVNDGDPGGDGHKKKGDVKKVRIGHGKDWVYVRATPSKGGTLGEFEEYWIDTRGGNPGPEFKVSSDTDFGDRFEVRRSDSFGDAFEDLGPLRCEGRVYRDGKNDISHRFRIPRQCLRLRGVGLPGQLRMSLHIESIQGNLGDWAPARRKFGPWVEVG